MNKILELDFWRPSTDVGLLLLRIWIGACLFVKHGWEKITHFPQMAAHFPDPIHIGPHASLAFALLSDAICSVLVALGIATRLAALIIIINLAVAFCLVHKFKLFGPGNGELPLAYLGVYLAILIAGAGRYSITGRYAKRVQREVRAPATSKVGS